MQTLLHWLQMLDILKAHRINSSGEDAYAEVQTGVLIRHAQPLVS